MAETNNESKTTDPAARLVLLLSRGAAVPAGQSYVQLWKTVFELPDEDIVEIHRRLDWMRELVDDVERSILRIPDIRHEVYARPLPAIRSILSRVALNEQWAPNKPVLEMALNGLEFCSERLQANSPEPIIEQTELDEIRGQVDDLIAQLKASETIPRKLRFLLFDLLDAIRRSIDEYLFKGTRGMRKRLFVIVAQLQESWGEIEANKATKEVSSFFKLLAKIDSVTATALKVKELLSGAAPFIPLLMQVGDHLIS